MSATLDAIMIARRIRTDMPVMAAGIGTPSW
jgi:hypothetical protein